MSRSKINIEDLVSEALLFNDRIGSAVIEVEDFNGIITLKGTIESEQDRLFAEALARKQEGVVDVINDLWVPFF
jgi:hyperosmotically inducible protein